MSAIGPRAWQGLVLVAVVLALLATRACEEYTLAYQAFPAVDWLESHPPLAEDRAIPPAADLARAFAGLAPELGPGSGVSHFSPDFTSPGIFVRRVSGVRDSARITRETPRDAPGQDRASVRLAVMVFHRAQRARAWADLRATRYDLARPTAGEERYFRVSGVDERDMVWLTPLQPHGGSRQDVVPGSVVVGTRGPVAFEVQTTSQRADWQQPGDTAELAARAEQLARRAAAAWTGWLAHQPYAADWP